VGYIRREIGGRGDGTIVEHVLIVYFHLPKYSLAKLHSSMLSHTYSLFSSRRIHQHRFFPHLPSQSGRVVQCKTPTPCIPHGDSSRLAAHPPTRVPPDRPGLRPTFRFLEDYGEAQLVDAGVLWELCVRVAGFPFW
jgi:hypothetical protein